MRAGDAGIEGAAPRSRATFLGALGQGLNSGEDGGLVVLVSGMCFVGACNWLTGAFY